MATTTTNFGWDIPQSTDLVKDGATAIAALGQDIDTALVDLKGGTTGQVLSKASGTDLDFTWVAQDDSNAIQNAIVDAKGDLIAATAADTPARLAVGTNGQVLTADSTAATGLAWAPVNATSMTLLSTTSLSGTSTTISSISGAYTNLMIIAKDVDTGTSNGNINLRFNGDSGSNYRNVGVTGATTAALFMNTNTFIPGTDMRTGGDPGNFVINLYRYTDTSKIQGNLAWNMNSTDEVTGGRSDFRYNASAAITSFTVTNSNSLSMTGTIYIYGVK